MSVVVAVKRVSLDQQDRGAMSPTRSTRIARIALLVGTLAICSSVETKEPKSPAITVDRGRYEQLVKLIHRNLHLGPHFAMTVDARTITAVRGTISEHDIPVLSAMLSDSDYTVASAASALLVTQGMNAVPTLLNAKQGPSAAATQAWDALRQIQRCYDENLWNQVNPDLCPADRVAHRGEKVEGAGE